MRKMGMIWYDFENHAIALLCFREYAGWMNARLVVAGDPKKKNSCEYLMFVEAIVTIASLL